MRKRVYAAAGGVALDPEGRVLLIERHVRRSGLDVHEVRLPKGHIEAGETAEAAALREVREETGYLHLSLVSDLGRAVTQLELDGEAVQRSEHYFLMRLDDLAADAGAFPDPDAEEALFRPLWAANLEAAAELLTYESERDFARRAAARCEAEGGPDSGRDSARG